MFVEKRCSVCERMIRSSSKKALDYNYRVHLGVCKEKEKIGIHRGRPKMYIKENILREFTDSIGMEWIVFKDKFGVLVSRPKHQIEKEVQYDRGDRRV